MKIVEIGAPFDVLCPKSASKTDYTALVFSYQYALIVFGRCKTFRPYRLSICENVSLEIIRTQCASVGELPTSGMQSCNGFGIAEGGKTEFHKA